MQRTFYESMLEMVEGDEILFSPLVFSDEATFHLFGTFNYHNVRIWGTYHPHETFEHQRDFSKMSAFCAVTWDKVFDLFFFKKTPLQDKAIWKCSQTGYSLYCKQIRLNDFIFQKDEHYLIGISEFILILLKTYPNDGLVREMLEILLSVLCLPNPRTSLCVTFSCGGMLKTKFILHCLHQILMK